MMRLFIAVEIDGSSRAACSRLIRELSASGAHVGWVKEGNIHITLQFLGPQEESSVKQITSVMEKSHDQIPPFTMNLEGLGAFPPKGPPRVIWVGVHDGAQELTALANRLGENLKSSGFPVEDRPFSAHVTIGRVKSPKNGKVLEEKLAQQHNSVIGSSRVERFVLMESKLSSEGPEYRVVYEERL